MNYDTLPDVCETTDIMDFLKRSRSTVTILLSQYRRLCISLKPYRITRDNLIKILNKSVPTDADERRKERCLKRLG